MTSAAPGGPLLGRPPPASPPADQAEGGTAELGEPLRPIGLQVSGHMNRARYRDENEAAHMRVEWRARVPQSAQARLGRCLGSRRWQAGHEDRARERARTPCVSLALIVGDQGRLARAAEESARGRGTKIVIAPTSEERRAGTMSVYLRGSRSRM